MASSNVPVGKIRSGRKASSPPLAAQMLSTKLERGGLGTKKANEGATFGIVNCCSLLTAMFPEEAVTSIYSDQNRANGKGQCTDDVRHGAVQRLRELERV